MRTRNEKRPTIFTWTVADRDNGFDKVKIQFHPDGMLSFKVGEKEINFANARLIGSLMVSHTKKKFSSFEAVKKEYDLIWDSIRQQHENAA